MVSFFNFFFYHFHILLAHVYSFSNWQTLHFLSSDNARMYKILNGLLCVNKFIFFSSAVFSVNVGCFIIAETKQWPLRSSLLTLFSFSFQIITGK